MIALTLLDRLSRDELSALAAAAIDRLDALDGDADCEDEDPSGGNILDEPHDAEEIHFPIYGIDQTAGELGFNRRLKWLADRWPRPELEVGVVVTSAAPCV